MSQDLKDYKVLQEAVSKAIQIILEATNKTGFEWPEFSLDADVDDGKTYTLHFERIS